MPTGQIRKILPVLALATLCASTIQAQKPSIAVENYLNRKEREGGLNGRVLVARADSILIDKSMAAPSGARPSSRFPVGPVAEQFAAVAVLQLEKEGRLSLDASLCNYIANCPESWGKIQIRHLLTHASGLPATDKVSPCGNTSSSLDIGELEKELAAIPLLFVPGSESRYNPVNLVFLWQVIAKASGHAPQEYLDGRIFGPLGLAHTGFSEPKVAVVNPEIDSTAEDLYRWQRALVENGPLPQNIREQMFVAYVEGQGLGFKILKEFDHKSAVQNSACKQGSLSVRNYVYDKTAVIVWLANDKQANEVSRDIGSILFGKRYPLNSSSPAH